MTPFDYEEMAREAEERLRVLEAGHRKIRRERPRCADQQLKKNARLLALEDEIMEERSRIKLFRSRARERKEKAEHGK